MATDAETLVRRAYRAAEGNVQDLEGFAALFADDGVIHAGKNTWRGPELGTIIEMLGGFMPDVHRELHRVHVIGNVVAIELSIQGTFTKPFMSPAGPIQPNGVKVNVPCGDFFYIENGKIKEFNCHAGVTVMFEQMGIQPNFAGAIQAQAASQ